MRRQILLIITIIIDIHAPHCPLFFLLHVLAGRLSSTGSGIFARYLSTLATPTRYAVVCILSLVEYMGEYQGWAGNTFHTGPGGIPSTAARLASFPFDLHFLHSDALTSSAMLHAKPFFGDQLAASVTKPAPSGFTTHHVTQKNLRTSYLLGTKHSHRFHEGYCFFCFL